MKRCKQDDKDLKSKQSKENITQFLHKCEPLLQIIQTIKEQGGVSYVTGGTVRDLLMARTIKDIDIEVHQISLQQLQAVLELFGEVQLVGKNFGVLQNKGTEVDWALPRTDSSGRKPKVEFDITMDLPAAAKRRDLTMNAMAIDLNYVHANFQHIKAEFESLEFVEHMHISSIFQIKDPYQGLKSIQAQQLILVDEKLFLEDHLRFFRVMQFHARFQFFPDAQLNKVCSEMVLQDSDTNQAIATERVYGEVHKMFMQSERPSFGFRWLNQVGRLEEVFPELHATINIKQRNKYHPEGSLFEHLMQCLDQAANFDFYQAFPDKQMSKGDVKFIVMLAALTHDLGKIACDRANCEEKISKVDHAVIGVPFAERFFSRISNNHLMTNQLRLLVRFHEEPRILVEKCAPLEDYKKLAVELSPYANLRLLGYVSFADLLGRHSLDEKIDFNTRAIGIYDEFVRRYELAGVGEMPEPPLLLGRHIQDLGYQGKEIGIILKIAYQIQMKNGLNDVQKIKSLAVKEYSASQVKCDTAIDKTDL